MYSKDVDSEASTRAHVVMQSSQDLHVDWLQVWTGLRWNL